MIKWVSCPLQKSLRSRSISPCSNESDKHPCGSRQNEVPEWPFIFRGAPPPPSTKAPDLSSLVNALSAMARPRPPAWHATTYEMARRRWRRCFAVASAVVEPVSPKVASDDNNGNANGPRQTAKPRDVDKHNERSITASKCD